MKRYTNILLWFTAIAVVVFVLVIVSNKRHNLSCSSINISFQNGVENKTYIDKKYINNLIQSDTIIGNPLDQTDIYKLELKLKNDPYIEKAEVYKEIDGTLNIELIQRIPLVRIINSYNIGYYIGEEGILMPISKKLSKRILVANGNITYSPVFDSLTNIYSKKFDQDRNISILRDIHKFTNFINNDKFWKAQIQQVYINDNREIELVPLVGNHIIELGGISMLEEKLNKLKAMYKKGFPSLGWNKYKTISLKYNRQVVCGKSG